MKNGINKYLKMLLEQNKTEVLGIALNLQLFDYLEKKNMNLEILANKLKIDKRNTNILLEALSMIDLVDKKDGFYENTPVARIYFVHGIDTYCGDVFLHRKEMLNHGRKAMLNLITKGSQDIAMTKNPKKWATASKQFLKQEQKNLIAHQAVDIVNNIKEFPKMEKMLDLGCASGILGLEIIKSHPTIKGILFDFPDVTDITNKYIEEYNLKDRVSVLSGNIQDDDIGGEYDLIWCSNIFYFLDNYTDTIKKIYNALNPNGILVSAHVEITDVSKNYEDSFFYFLGLNLQGRKIFKPMEISNTLETVGFKSINSYTITNLPMTPTQIHIAKK